MHNETGTKNCDIGILAYWKKKSIPSEAGKSESDKEASQDANDQCENIFRNEKGLKIHMGKAHKTVSPVEKTRSSSSDPSLMPSLSDTEDREEDLRFEEEIRFHKENPNTCEF